MSSEAGWVEGYTKDYDELAALPPAAKTKRLSVISSDKAQTEGHRQRLDFTPPQEHFGDRIDVFGRGIRTLRTSGTIRECCSPAGSKDKGRYPNSPAGRVQSNHIIFHLERQIRPAGGDELAHFLQCGWFFSCRKSRASSMRMT